MCTTDSISRVCVVLMGGREMEAMVSKKHGEELAMVAAPNYSPTSQDMEHNNLLIPLKVIDMKV